MLGTGFDHSSDAKLVDFPSTTAAVCFDIPIEPDDTCSDVAKLKIKLPSGKLLKRNFLYSTHARQLFHFLACVLQVGADRLKDIQVSARFPARSWKYEEQNCEMSLTELGLALPQESLFVTLLS